MKASAYLLLAKRRQKQNGKYPVKIRIVFQRKPKDYKIGLDLSEEEYKEALKEKPTKEFKETGIKIKVAIGKANTIIQTMGMFSFTKFESAFYENRKSLTSGKLLDLFERYISNLNEQGNVGTAISYQTTYNSLNTFKTNLTIFDINTKLLKKYEEHMLGNGKSLTTIGIYLRQLRALYNHAISQNILSKEDYPFGKGKYVIPVGNNVKKALASSELELLLNYSPKNKDEEQALDFWIFSYLSNGMNFCDIAKLKWENINGEFINYIRSKTKNTKKGSQQGITVPIHIRAKMIIKKWGSLDSAGSYVFPILKEELTPLQIKYRVQGFIKFTNTQMETIRQNLKISLPCNTYSCRHSFATVLKRKNISTEFISESLGHSSLVTTTAYLASFENKTKIEYSNLLTDF